MALGFEVELSLIRPLVTTGAGKPPVQLLAASHPTFDPIKTPINSLTIITFTVQKNYNAKKLIELVGRHEIQQ